jgi:hypothetical protein
MSTPPPTNPPPDSPVKGKPPMQGDVAGTPAQAIVVGLVIDIVGSIVASELLRLAYRLGLVHAGLPDDEVRRTMDGLGPNSALGVLEMLCGWACSVAGGYACARVVMRDEARFGALMVVLSCLITGGDGPLDLQLLDIACEAACVMLGVMYGARRNHRPAAPPGASPP